jgi:prefoldin subunit 5
MSVHHESLEINRPVERVQEPPTLEYNAVRNDSLTMFGAAIGGAILGMLLTLLVLAVINGGTLSFSGGQRLDILEASVTRIDENVGAVSYNVDMVAQQAQALQTQLVTLESEFGDDLAAVDGNIGELRGAVETLNRSTTQFTAFLAALDQALSDATSALDEVAP